ncbi:MAG: lysylphosphatidylglycerol synthase transmembrane domain-containing protein [Candidatus Omnitrophota bacterium]
MIKSKKVVTTIRVAVCLFLVYLIATRFDVGKIMQAVKLVDASVFLYILGAYTLANLFVFLRWYLIMRYMDMKVSLPVAVKCYMMGVFFNFFMPTAVGGDVFKAYYVSKNSENSRIEKSLFSVFFDRYLGLLVMLGAGGFFSLFLDIRISGFPLSWILFTVLAGLFLLSVFVTLFADKMDRLIEKIGFLKRNFSDTFKKISNTLNIVKRNKKIFLGVVACTLGALVMISMMHYIFISKIGKINVFFPMLVFVPVAILVTMIPISINGIGLREIVYVTLFGTIDVNPAVSIAMSILFYGVMVVFSLPGAVYSFGAILGKKEMKK